MSAQRFTVSVLIVDDCPEDRNSTTNEVKSFFSEISSSSLNIKRAASAPEMLKLLREEDYHIVLLDHELGLDPIMQPILGVDFIPTVREIQPATRVIMVTSHENTRLSALAIKNGAFDFVVKGQGHEEDRKDVFLKALKEARFELEIERRNLISDQVDQKDYQFKSQTMKALDLKLQALAEVKSHVLFVGEPGLGKTHSAKRLSYLTAEHLKDPGFVFENININATPNNLLASALFGHEKGAFTGADEQHLGLFERASKGCLFLDEIGDASLEMQALLLKVVEERIFQRVGGKQTLKTNARMIFATNKDLKKMVNDGSFRKDLYDRISAVTIKMPHLKDRRPDIPYICQNMTDKLKRIHGKNISYNDFPKELKDYLTSGLVPGNIRGIENYLIKLVSLSKTLSSGKLDYSMWKETLKEDLTENFIDFNNLNGNSLDEIVEALTNKIEDNDWPGLPSLKKIIEKRFIQKAHDKSDDNKVRAKLLGISLQSIYQKNEKYFKG